MFAFSMHAASKVSYGSTRCPVPTPESRIYFGRCDADVFISPAQC